VSKLKKCALLMCAVIPTACTSNDRGQKPTEAPFARIMAVTVRVVTFTTPIDGKSEGLEFALTRSGGGFPVRANSDPVLVVGEVVVIHYSFTPEGISFFSTQRDALQPGSPIIIRWGDGPNAPTVDTGASYEPGAVKALESIRPHVQ
jgi:hypothetical protein